MTTTVTVEFGSEPTTFTGAEIKSARIVEQIDPVSVELPINTLELRLFSAAGDFSIIDPSGFYANLKYKEPLDVYENFGAGNVFMGRFYLDKWESISENEAVFEASDAIGVLESKTCLGWEIPNGFLDTDVIIDRIETETGLTITLDASLAGISISGWVPVTTYREALKQFCFLMRAHATCARSSVITIVPMEILWAYSTYDHVITAAQKGLGQPLKLLPFVTSVEVDSHFHTTDFVNKQVFSGELSAGTHRVIFDTPKRCNSATITGATDVTAIDAVNYIDLSVPTTGTVTLEVADFVDSIKTVSVSGTVPAGTQPNIIKIADAFMVSGNPLTDTRPENVAQWVYDYYQRRYLQKAKFYGLQVVTGDSVLIAAQSGWIGGIIERMEIDLAGGFVSQVEIVGIVTSTCTNILTANLTVLTGVDQTYTGCLDMFTYNVDLQGTANLIIN